MIADITFWNALLHTRGQRHRSVPWDKLFEQLTTPLDWRADLHPGWSAATFADDTRSKANVERVHALVLDVDGTWDLTDARDAFCGYYGLIHTSKSHTDDVHRFRIVLPFSRPVSAFELEAIWRRVDAEWPNRFDPQCKDASRFWYLPGGPNNDAFSWVNLDGDPLNPDKWLAMPEPVQLVEALPGQAFESSCDVEERARRYLAKMDPSIQGQRGSWACFKAASVLVRGFELPESTAFAMLRSDFNPRCVPPWSDKELRHKVASVLKVGKLPMGWLLNASNRDVWTEPSPEQVAEREPEPEPDPDAEREPAWKRFGVRRMIDVLNDVYSRLNAKTEAPSCPTGCGMLDVVIGGYRPCKVTVLGAQTNWGKSSWAVMAVDEALKAGKRPLLVSGEDDALTYGKRILARRGQLSAMQLRNERVSEHDKGEVWKLVCASEDVPWFINGVGVPAEVLAERVKTLCIEDGYDLVVVDYLQAFGLRTKVQDRRNEVTKVAREFTDAIKNGGAAGLLLSQLKRLESDNKEPSKHDLKESGDIENMAEHVILGWQGKDGNRLMKVDKNKDGPVWVKAIDVPFSNKSACFLRTSKPHDFDDSMPEAHDDVTMPTYNWEKHMRDER